MTKKAMVDLLRAGVVPLVQVHDELNFSVGEIDEVLQLKEMMESAVELEVPVVADVELGPSWGEGVKYEQRGNKLLAATS